MPATGSCPTQEELLQLALGKADHTQLEEFAQHLEQCAQCAERLEGVAGYQGLLSEMRRAAHMLPAAPDATPSQIPAPQPVIQGLTVDAPRPTPEPLEGDPGNDQDQLATKPTFPAPAKEPGTASHLPSLPGYEMLSKLGEGGMGVVYQARHLRLNRLVAVKMILGGGWISPVHQVRFRAEAQAVAQLAHPNIIQIHEIGEHAGLPYFTLEFCDGGSLAQKLAGTPLPPQEAAQLVETLARAMHHAHERKIIHRDLKPANILLRIADCGLRIADC